MTATPHSPTPATRVLRGLTLHCPECGSSGILASWFRLRASCPKCRMLLDRGQRDYFVGAYLINLIISELLFAIGFGSWMLRSWPNIPWDAVQYVAVAAMIIAPLATYPITKSTWLAVDLVFQPPSEREFLEDSQRK